MRTIKHISANSLVLALVGMPVTIAAASEVCVVCEEPQATYSCSVPDQLGSVRASVAKRALGFGCVQDIAHAYGHGSCRVKLDRNRPCLGTPHQLVSLEGSAPRANSPYDPNTAGQPRQSASEHPVAGESGPAEQEPQAGAENAEHKKEPETVVELAKETADASKRQLQQAQKAIQDTAKDVSDGVSGAAKTSWRCISSLFLNCW